MNATDIYNHVRALEGIVATLNRENQNLRENGSGDVATTMKLTAELRDCQRTFTVEDIKGWLNWRADEVAKDGNSISATERRWLADIVSVECSGIVAWKLGQK